MSNLFQKTSNGHSYNTRSPTSGKFFVKSSRLEIQNNFFLGSELGCGIRNQSSKKAFKRVLRKLPFDISEMEDDYIEIPLIIKRVAT